MPTLAARLHAHNQSSFSSSLPGYLRIAASSWSLLVTAFLSFVIFVRTKLPAVAPGEGGCRIKSGMTRRTGAASRASRPSREIPTACAAVTGAAP